MVAHPTAVLHTPVNAKRCIVRLDEFLVATCWSAIAADGAHGRSPIDKIPETIIHRLSCNRRVFTEGLA
jgi:hypothetical protein